MSDLDLTALDLARQIRSGKTDPRELIRACLERAETADLDHSIFVRFMKSRALAEAGEVFARARAGTLRSKLDGVPVAWKDNIDIAGVPAEGGSKLLKGRIPDRDAPLASKVAQAGLVSFSKTNMTELAFSGLGYNPYTGTPRNAHDANIARLPGGSSSGAGVAVARHLAPIAVGTDTGGSVRIPASWNGIVGLKTTAGRHGTDGLVLLSASLDTVGPIARDVADAAALFEILFDEPSIALGELSAGDVRLLALEGSVLGALDNATRGAFSAAMETLGKRDIRIERKSVTSVEAAGAVSSPAGYEAYQLYGPRIEETPGLVWDLVAERVLAGKSITREAYASALARLSDLSRQFKDETAGYDAVLMPTVAMTAPAISEVEASADAYRSINVRALSLPSLANRLGLCAITIPLPSASLPIGLTILGRPLEERRLLAVAALLEELLAA